jgi:hypothetical protein
MGIRWGRGIQSRHRGAADRSDGAGQDGSGGDLAARTDYPPHTQQTKAARTAMASVSPRVIHRPNERNFGVRRP